MVVANMLCISVDKMPKQKNKRAVHAWLYMLVVKCRAAYESRAARVALVREKNAKKERRRELRALGSAERAVHLAEQGVPLFARAASRKAR